MIVKAAAGTVTGATMTTRPDRAERLAAQLRANLARRKQQAREVAATPDDQCAKASDPSDIAAPAA